MKYSKSEEVIAEEVEEALEDVHQICEVARKYAPDYDVDKIYQELYGIENSEEI